MNLFLPFSVFFLKKKKKKKTVEIAIRVYDNGRRQYDESVSHFLLKFVKILANRLLKTEHRDFKATRYIGKLKCLGRKQVIMGFKVTLYK